MKNNQQMTVQVRGSGNSKQRAFAAALAQVQREVLKNSSNIILRIQPMDLEIVSATESVSTERFLFLFLPRKKEVYDVILNVTIDVAFVDIKNVNFTSK